MYPKANPVPKHFYKKNIYKISKIVLSFLFAPTPLPQKFYTSFPRLYKN
jgi:hypothetical protein